MANRGWTCGNSPPPPSPTGTAEPPFSLGHALSVVGWAQAASSLATVAAAPLQTQADITSLHQLLSLLFFQVLFLQGLETDFLKMKAEMQTSLQDSWREPRPTAQACDVSQPWHPVLLARMQAALSLPCLRRQNSIASDSTST